MKDGTRVDLLPILQKAWLFSFLRVLYQARRESRTVSPSTIKTQPINYCESLKEVYDNLTCINAGSSTGKYKTNQNFVEASEHIDMD